MIFLRSAVWFFKEVLLIHYGSADLLRGLWRGDKDQRKGRACSRKVSSGSGILKIWKPVSCVRNDYREDCMGMHRPPSAPITVSTVDAMSSPPSTPPQANPTLLHSFDLSSTHIRDLSHSLSFGGSARQKNSLRSPLEAGLGAVTSAVQMVAKPAIDLRAHLLSLLSRPLWQIAFSKGVWVGGLVWLYASSLVGRSAAPALISGIMTRLAETIAWAFSAVRVRVEK
jgi:hypothetical protein